MERIGVFTTDARRGAFEAALAGAVLDVRSAPGSSAVGALEAFEASGCSVAVVDDHALEPPGDEAYLLGWARVATASAPRLVMVFDGTRDAEDAFLYQLVSTADVKDLVVTSVGDTMAETLPARVARPARLMDVAHWKTTDKRKLKRRDMRSGAWEAVTSRLPATLRCKGPAGGGREGGAAREPSREAGEGRGEGSKMPPVKLDGAPSAASLLSGGPAFGVAMRNEGGTPALDCPSAPAIVAVGAASRGIGCTHLSCALALELAGKGIETCCAVYNPATFDAMRRALAPDSARNDRFAFGGVEFFSWGAQRAHAGEFDCVVCDCGLVDYPDDDQASPASLFRRAGFQAMLVSGAPWLLDESSAAIAVRDPAALAAVTWFTTSAGPIVSANIASAIAQASGRGRAEVVPVPYRPDLLCGDGSRYSDYAALLDGVVAAARAVKVDPEEFARRTAKRRSG